MSKQLSPGGEAKKKALENYVQVKDRVKQFRSDHPDYGIITELLHHEPGISATFKAVITDDKNRVIATGHAHDKTSDNTHINITSLIENCETSAVGRALAFLGYGIDKAIASHEEVAQSNKPTIYTGTNKQKGTLARCLRSAGVKDPVRAKEIHERLIEEAIEDDITSITNYIKEYTA